MSTELDKFILDTLSGYTSDNDNNKICNFTRQSRKEDDNPTNNNNDTLIVMVMETILIKVETMAVTLTVVGIVAMTVTLINATVVTPIVT